MNTSPARSSQVAFPHASHWDDSWCWRHDSALLFVPDSRSSTTWAFKAGVNFRRLDSLNSLLHTIILALHRCPNFGDNYRRYKAEMVAGRDSCKVGILLANLFHPLQS